jgi:CRP-like cAMP-binding protein
VFKRGPNEPEAIPAIPEGWHVQDLGLLGRGGMSVVHRIRDETLGREIALKVLRPELARDSRAVDYFVQEAQVTALLDHPNIPPVYAFAAEKRIHCFTMKVLQGTTFDQFLQAKPDLAPDTLFAALEVLVRVCDALSFAHARGIFHCDLKPQNIMVGEHAQIYVVDWGLARRRGVPSPFPDHSGTPVGTPAYMAPEQARGQNSAVDERTDIFQVGAVLYRVLAGKAPFSMGNAPAALEAARLCRPAALEQLPRPIPRRLAAICARAMAESAADRYPTATALRGELEDFIHGTSRLPEMTFQAGEAIVREGEPGDRAYIILDGHCQASKGRPGASTGLRLMGPGEMFGETAVLTGSLRLATVTALVDTTVAVVDQTYLQEEMQRTPLIALAIRAVAERFLDLDGRTQALTVEQARFRVIDLALQALALEGQPLPQGLGRCVPWASLRARIASETGLADDDIDARIHRHPKLRLESEVDRLVLKTQDPDRPPG